MYNCGRNSRLNICWSLIDWPSTKWSLSDGVLILKVESPIICNGLNSWGHILFNRHQVSEKNIFDDKSILFQGKDWCFTHQANTLDQFHLDVYHHIASLSHNGNENANGIPWDDHAERLNHYFIEKIDHTRDHLVNTPDLTNIDHPSRGALISSFFFIGI